MRNQLDTAADDPDLPELFEYLISLGVGKNTYVDDLMAFTQIFVDSKCRQLRYSAFQVPNRMCKNSPWSKIAMMKRCYRKKPLNGFCPSPEQCWTQVGADRLDYLEALLQYFHVTCKPALDRLTPFHRNHALGNIDVAAADAFINAKRDNHNKKGCVFDESLPRLA